MFKAKVLGKNNNTIEYFGNDDLQQKIKQWIGKEFGLPERWISASESHDPADVIEREVREIAPAVEATVDEQGNELSPATDAITEEWVKLRAEYTVEIEDISAQLEQERINKEALDYLASTDWLIIREIDAGVACPAEIKQARAEARARIVR